jgi:uncharacterized protein
MSAEQIIQNRQEKDRFFKSHLQSPLSPEQRENFNGLSYYDYNGELVFRLKPEIFSEKANLKMQTSTGDIRYYIRWGKVRFTVEGHEAELTLFATPGSDEFFIPFTDLTSGKETYGAGRYVEAYEDDGLIHLDFNLAYNPYCAYSPKWNCPIPPAENRLKVPIHAGEKMPEGNWVAKDDV